MTKLNTELFIERAIELHGDKYDYSLVEYVHHKTRVKINCKTHGVFEQLPSDHLRNRGCRLCVFDSLRFDTEKFIAKAKSKHGDKYDYSLVDYKRSQDKVKIICPAHGVFEQKANKHLMGDGCRKCAGHVDGVEGFIEKAIKAHGNKYDYSKAVYKGARDSLEIICPKHGSFWQVAGHHTTGKGCNQCALDYRGNKKRRTKSSFIKEAKAFHNGKYDYSDLKYTKMSDPTVFICPIHGEFTQTPTVHLRSGCNRCSGKGQDMEERIARAKETHGDKYDYSKTEYTSPQEKVTITCPEHGDFQQTMIHHINGTGCPQCPQKRDLPAYIYVLRSDNGLSKIGVSRKIGYRIYQLKRGGQPFDCDLFYSILCDNKYQAVLAEGIAHKMIKKKRAGFRGFDGATEWFQVPPAEAVNIIKQAVKEVRSLAA